MTRRIVRVEAQFFAELDAQLNESRGPAGEPSGRCFTANSITGALGQARPGTMWHRNRAVIEWPPGNCEPGFVEP